jgi:hypothetical protein
MHRKVAVLAVALFVVMGVGRAWSQAPPSQATPALVYYESAKVVVNGEAQANGTLEMTFTPQNGATKSFKVTVLAKATKKDIARDIHKELSIAAGTVYNVKLDNENVKISKVKKESPNFSVAIGKVELAGVSIMVGKD